MEHLKRSNPEAQNQFSLYQNSKRIIKFLLLFSLFSVLLSSLPLLLHSLNAFLVKLCSYSILKNYLFLLCNGLLVFIAKNSGLIHGSPSPTTHQTEEIVKNNVGASRKSESREVKITEPSTGENGKETEFPVEEEKSLVTVEQKEEIINSEEKSEEVEGEGKQIMIIDEDQHAAEEETEELNKKCEDFIRKMKAAFCSEPKIYNYEFDRRTAIVAN